LTQQRMNAGNKVGSTGVTGAYARNPLGRTSSCPGRYDQKNCPPGRQATSSGSRPWPRVRATLCKRCWP
jgi:hypothetical protein